MEAIKENPAKYLGIVGALLALAATYIPGLPTEAILAVVAALIGGGVAAQRVEDRKTDYAYDAMPEDAPAIRRQNQLLEALLEQGRDQPRPAPDDAPTAYMPNGPVTWGK
ncbi:hypothetical protein ACFYYS_06255 [Streptomyces sp. NPDC002120]|uniref:hypothetical protein n=1 Tax=Streptomyces sp. NPDC002120 TaxID=3364631 RepID=UPI00369FF689